MPLVGDGGAPSARGWPACADDSTQIALQGFQPRITRAHSLAAPTQLDNEIFEQVRPTLRKNWSRGTQVRLLGCKPHPLRVKRSREICWKTGRRQRWQQALSGGPIACGTSLASPALPWPAGFAEAFASVPTRIRRACQERTVREPQMNVRVPISHAFREKAGSIRTTRPADVRLVIFIFNIPKPFVVMGLRGRNGRFSQKCARIGAPRVSPGLY